MKKLLPLLLCGLAATTAVDAQLAKDNKCKFLGNITTSYNWVEYTDPQGCNLSYADYWNQVTCENATKWGSIHKGWGQFDWTSADKTYNYCKQHGIKFKFHCLIWGSQHPTWIESLSAADTKKAIIEWYDAVKEHFPDLEIIDVVNEAIYSGSDYHSPYKQTKIIEALGGTANGYSGTDSYKWIAEAFKLARERWPNAVLIYNDYNTFKWQKTEFINIIKALKTLNAPIDAAGCQSHDLNDMGGTEFKTALEDIHNQIQLPIYITEYDIAQSDDQTQLTRYKEQFPTMWEADYVAGVTLWGWVYGKTWTTDGNSGILKDCSKRPAFTWLEEYMKTDAAKNAQSPICAGNSINATLTLNNSTISLGDSVKITATATTTSSVDHIDMFANDELLVHKYMTPYEWYFTPSEAGTYTIKIVAYDADGNTSEKTEKLTVCAAKEPYTAMTIPGVIEAEDYDYGCDGTAFHDADTENEGGEYRTDGVDIVTGNGSYALGYTAANEWVEYTVDVKETGNYTVESTVASGSDNSGFHLTLTTNGASTALTDKIEVANGGDWDTYSTVKTDLNQKLTAGTQTIRLTIDGAYCNIDKLTFKCKDCVSTGFDETYASHSGIKIYPNPAKTYINIDTDEEIEMAELIDVMGKTIKRDNSKKMSIADVADGIYILSVTTPTQNKKLKVTISK